jgi:DNA-binding NarL/FixJ family response regulator
MTDRGIFELFDEHSARDRALARDLQARARLAADPIAQIIMNRDPTYRPDGYRPDYSIRHQKPLTPREIEVLRYLSLGLEYEMVAEALGRSLETIKSQAKSARTKLGGAKNSAQACCEAVRRGLIP